MDPEFRLLALQMALKCSDLGHLACNSTAHLRWVQKLEQEFFGQARSHAPEHPDSGPWRRSLVTGWMMQRLTILPIVHFVWKQACKVPDTCTVQQISLTGLKTTASSCLLYSPTVLYCCHRAQGDQDRALLPPSPP